MLWMGIWPCCFVGRLVVIRATEVVAALGADEFAVVAGEAVAAGGADLAVVIDGLDAGR